MKKWLARQRILAAMGLSMLGAGVALAQMITLEPPTPVASKPAPAAPAGAAAGAGTLPSAESVLQELLRQKNGEGTATAPTSPLAAATGPALDADGLLREGQVLDLRRGHLMKDANGSMLFVFDPRDQPAYPPMGVVPTRHLAAMEDAAGFGAGRNGSDMMFQISADITRYRGKNYLYLEPTGMPLPPATTPAPPPASSAAPIQAAAPETAVVQQIPQGTLIWDRTGRLVRETKSGAEIFVLDSDGKQMLDPPMGVIPCTMLAVMEDATEGGVKPLRFKISGKVTEYRGKNFLYLKAMSVVKDLNRGIGPGLGGVETVPPPATNAGH